MIFFSLNDCVFDLQSETIFVTKQRNAVKFDRARDVWFLFLRLFWLLFPKFKFWNRGRALYYVPIENWEFQFQSQAILQLLRQLIYFVMVWTCTKTLWSSKILWKGLFKSFYFALNISNDDLTFWKKCSFDLSFLVLSKHYQ